MLAVVDDPSSVSPGLAGFLAVFFLAIATWLLIRSMVGHLRRVRYGPGPQSDLTDQPGEQETVDQDGGPGAPKP